MIVAVAADERHVGAGLQHPNHSRICRRGRADPAPTVMIVPLGPGLEEQAPRGHWLELVGIAARVVRIRMIGIEARREVLRERRHQAVMNAAVRAAKGRSIEVQHAGLLTSGVRQPWQPFQVDGASSGHASAHAGSFGSNVSHVGVGGGTATSFGGSGISVLPGSIGDRVFLERRHELVRAGIAAARCVHAYEVRAACVRDRRHLAMVGARAGRRSDVDRRGPLIEDVERDVKVRARGHDSSS